MKINLTITKDSTKQRLEFNLPSSWHEVTFEQFIGLIDCDTDTVKTVALFTGLDEELIRSAEVHNLNSVIASLSFLATKPIYGTPKSILGYKIPGNLEWTTIAQYEDLKAVMKGFKEDDPKHNYSLFPLIVATYAIDPYDFKKAEAIKDGFLKAPCMEVMATANFTLVKLNALSRGIRKTSRQAVIPPSRWKLAMSDWLLNSISTIRYYTWKRSLPSSERKFLNGL